MRHATTGSERKPPSTVRVAAVTLLTAALGAALAGCGGGRSERLAASGASDVGKPITKAHAIAYAHAVNLRAADVIGMASKPGETEKEDAAETESAKELNRCAGGVGSEHQLVDVKSPQFVRGGGQLREEVGSGVSVMSSAALANQDLGAVRSERGRACIEQFAVRQFSEDLGSAKVGRITTSPLAAPTEGIDRSFGLRVTVTLIPPGAELEVPIYLDFLGFVSGPSEVDLDAVGVSRPVSGVTEHRLLGLLDRRAALARL